MEFHDDREWQREAFMRVNTYTYLRFWIAIHISIFSLVMHCSIHIFVLSHWIFKFTFSIPKKSSCSSFKWFSILINISLWVIEYNHHFFRFEAHILHFVAATISFVRTDFSFTSYRGGSSRKSMYDYVGFYNIYLPLRMKCPKTISQLDFYDNFLQGRLGMSLYEMETSLRALLAFSYSTSISKRIFVNNEQQRSFNMNSKVW